jgi:hypothetical protein
MQTLGPLEVVVLTFPGAENQGEMLAVLERIEAKSDVRVVDVAMVRRFADGSIDAIELAELPLEAQTPRRQEYAATHLLNEDDITELAGLVQQPDTSAMALVVERTWEAELAEEARQHGGALTGSARIPDDQVDEVLAVAVEI